MKISRALAAAAVATLGFAPVARAQGNPIDEALQGETSGLDQRISIDVRDKDIREVAELIQAAVGVNIYVDVGVHAEHITLHLTDIPWRQALDLLARQADVEVEERSPQLYILTQPPRVSMDFTDADIRVVLDILARQSGQNIVISPRVTGRVTLTLRAVDWREALDTIAASVGAQVVQAGDRLLRVAMRDEVRDETFVEVIPLRYILPPPSYRAIASGAGRAGGGGGAGGSAPLGGRGSFFLYASDVSVEDFGLFVALKDVVESVAAGAQPGGSIRYNAETNSFIVRGTRPQIEEIRTIINTLDREPEQVFVDLKFITTTASNLRQIGSEWDDFSTVGAQGLEIGGTGGNFSFNIGEGLDAFGQAFRIPAVLNFGRSDVLLHALEQFEDTKVTQAPTLMTLNDAEATIFVGENVPYANQKARVDQNGNVTITIEEGDDSPVSVGFSLFISPHIVRESDQIILTIIPRVTELVGRTSPVIGFERFSFTDPVSGLSTFIDLPRTADQTLVTRLMVRSGHTAVIGGLVSERILERTTEVPILSEIPVIGDLLFRYRERESRVQDLLIFITPRVVRFSTDGTIHRVEASELFDRYYRIQQQNDPFAGGGSSDDQRGYGRHAQAYDAIDEESAAPAMGGPIGTVPAAVETRPVPVVVQPAEEAPEAPAVEGAPTGPAPESAPDGGQP